MTLGGAVLAGGNSRRMGTDKALIRIDGVALVRKAFTALEQAGADPVHIIGGDAPALTRIGLVPIADRWPGEGPLGAIITALDSIARDWVAVLSCDLLSPTPDAVRAVVEAAAESDVAVPLVDGRYQWLHAVWSRSARHALRASFDQGVRAPSVAAERLSVVAVHVSEASWFADADTPADLPGDTKDAEPDHPSPVGGVRSLPSMPQEGA